MTSRKLRSATSIQITYFFLWMWGEEVLCEIENLDPMPQSMFLLEPRIRWPFELGLLCLAVLCQTALNGEKTRLKNLMLGDL